MELLEKELGRLEGVRTAKVRGPTDDDMFYYRLEILESKPLRPSRLRKLADKLVVYPYLGMEATLAGRVEGTEERFVLVARGSKLRYALKPTDALRRLVAAGKTRLTLSGKIGETGSPPSLVLTVTSAKETEK